MAIPTYTRITERSSADLHGYAPILNPFLLTESQPVELIPGYTVVRASAAQIDRFRELLVAHSNPKAFSLIANYEYGMVEEKTAQGTQREFQHLPESEWRYNVVASDFMDKTHDALSVSDFRLHELETASSVSDVQLHTPIAFWFGGTVGYPARLSHFLANAPYGAEWPKVSAALLADVGDAYREMIAVRETYPEVSRALRILNALRMLPANSEFEVLGLFSIIEMLITHNPKLEDRGDSITHQMKGKIPLLSRRFRRPLDYSRFGATKENKVWERLYSYRSFLAHGGVPDFREGDLAILRSHENAVSFLREAVRALVRHSFKEPQLLRDLREC